jgi:tol-pal system protein YbgF
VNVRASILSAACLAAAGLAGCATTPPEQDPVQIKLNDLDTRLARIERVAANQSMLDLANQVEALRNDVRSMHNDVDQLSHSLDLAHKQQHDLYADLDQRMKTLEARGAAGGASTPSGGAASGGAGGGAAAAAALAAGAASPPQSGDVADKVSYQAAFDLLKAGQYDRAIAAFQSFLSTYPSSPLADNAQYWLGEAYYVNRSFPDSLAAFQRVVANYPLSRKLPDALLKMGFCYYELKQFSVARDVLTQVTMQFADSPAGKLAQQRLDKMTDEKH